MQLNRREHPKIKSKLHPRNKHRERYDFKTLIVSCPELAPFVKVNEYNDETIDFFDSEAVKMLNKALLSHFYNIGKWDIPQNYLCPPIPGRADYIHYIADVLGSYRHGEIPTGSQIKGLDIGVGANCIYPIIGTREYGWSFVGSDIDSVAIDSAQHITEENQLLHGVVELRLQKEPTTIFSGIIQPNEQFDFTVCNPPFHASPDEAKAGTVRKLSNLHQKRITKATLNFGGQNNELWCDGGEKRFVYNMIMESRKVAANCFLFSTLISKESNLNAVYSALKKVEAIDVKTIPMGQGNKVSRMVVWTFLTKLQQNEWVDKRW